MPRRSLTSGASTDELAERRARLEAKRLIREAELEVMSDVLTCAAPDCEARLEATGIAWKPDGTLQMEVVRKNVAGWVVNNGGFGRLECWCPVHGAGMKGMRV